jgi:hypothetical protein
MRSTRFGCSRFDVTNSASSSSAADAKQAELQYQWSRIQIPALWADACRSVSER